MDLLVKATLAILLLGALAAVLSQLLFMIAVIAIPVGMILILIKVFSSTEGE